MKDITNPDQEVTKEVIARPNSVNLSMPWELYKLLNWEHNDGLEWSFIDKDRVLVKRIPKEGGNTGDVIPEGMFTPVPNPVAETVPLAPERIAEIEKQLQDSLPPDWDQGSLPPDWDPSMLNNGKNNIAIEVDAKDDDSDESVSE